jgi:GntR family transcriptional regulator, rspAB operon transcriptional repressor
MSEQTLAEQIAGSLRRDILLGKLAPGALIKERDSSAGRGVSRTPLREAIRILASEGLVVLRPSRSPVVADPSQKEIIDDLTVMNALESLGARLACVSVTDTELAEIVALHEKMLTISDTADAVDYFEVDMRFHRLITAASHNASLIDTHAAYMARLWRPRFLAASLRSDRPRVLQQHGAIVKGLKTRDVTLVSAEVESHMRHLVLNITDIYDRKENPATPKAARV